MKTEVVKGMCEHCGLAFEGTIELNDGAFGTVICPKCGQETENFDSDYAVDTRDKEENEVIEYTKFETLKTV